MSFSTISGENMNSYSTDSFVSDGSKEIRAGYLKKKVKSGISLGPQWKYGYAVLTKDKRLHFVLDNEKSVVNLDGAAVVKVSDKECSCGFAIRVNGVADILIFAALGGNDANNNWMKAINNVINGIDEQSIQLEQEMSESIRVNKELEDLKVKVLGLKKNLRFNHNEAEEQLTAYTSQVQKLTNTVIALDKNRLQPLALEVVTLRKDLLATREELKELNVLKQDLNAALQVLKQIMMNN